MFTIETKLSFHGKTTRPKLLDLFCGAGGASLGYHRAGFDVVGVDIAPQPRYPFEFVQGDAIAYYQEYGHQFDAIAASPPCQFASTISGTGKGKGRQYINLIPATRNAIVATGKPYIIENVAGARPHLINPIMLCGTMFDLKVYRHRLFESNTPLSAPPHFPHEDSSPGCNGDRTSPKGFITVCGGRGGGFRLEPARAAMGIDWMTRGELAQAIPPAYTEYLGSQLLTYIQNQKNKATLEQCK
jgi:DNA (cytosine-5)-methyltransferase 1